MGIVSRKIASLTLDRLETLPGPCRSCVFWELDAVRRERVCRHPELAAAEKDVWLSHVLREWGSCGQVALVDDQVVGYLAYAPAAFVPGVEQFPTAPVSPDAVVLTTVYLDPAHRGGGLGRMLIQAMARDLIRRGGIRAVEVFGDTRGRTGHCVVPAEFCSRVGFKTQRAHSLSPRMRMDLRSALTWKDEVEQALERLLGAVRPMLPKPSRHSARSTRV
jgi:GNAT superfamily N-acetyltransferase